MSVRHTFVVLFALIASSSLQAQTASFASLDHPASASVLAMGSVQATTTSVSMGMFVENPSLANDSLLGEWMVGYSVLPNGVGMVHASGILPAKKINHIQLAVRRMGFGTIESFDEAGVYIGDFKAAENSISVSTSFTEGNFSFGTQLKWAISSLGGFNANALMMDLGGSWQHPSKELSFGLVLRNLGFVINDFTNSSSSQTPMGIRGGAAFKPQYMPFRFSLTAFSGLTGNSSVLVSEESDLKRKVTSYLNVGGEFIWSPNFQVLMGFNFLDRQELRLEGGAFGAGFSAGARLSKNGFSLEYGHANRHVGSSVNQISLGISIENIVTKN